MAYGLSFMPGGDNAGGNANRQDEARVTPAQEAIKLLSLRLPSVVGARALAPNTLMQSPGGAGLAGPGGMSVDAMIEWLRKQMQQSQASTPPQAATLFQPPSAGGAPSPSQPRQDGTPVSRQQSQRGQPQPMSAFPPPPVVRPGDEPKPPPLVPEAGPSSPPQVLSLEPEPVWPREIERNEDEYHRG